jgi:23S rRNA (uridine2552-2'-O)-methyltransferase
VARKSGSGSHWRQRQGSDAFFQLAAERDVRSRAYFKLEQIQKKERILKPASTCADLGSTPGGWSQYAASIVGERGSVLAVDLEPMAPLNGVTFLQGDFTLDSTQHAIKNALRGSLLDLVMSDMAPKLTGNRAVDQPRLMALAEDALSFSEICLRPGGIFLVKLFQGEGFESFVSLVRRRFQSIRVLKPQASRPESREMYLLARNYQI